MTHELNPLNLDGLKKTVRERDRHRCMNCGVSGSRAVLDVHHIVPRGQGGSNRLSNLVLLCRQCHNAAHEEAMAPTIKFENGTMGEREFQMYIEYWNAVDVAIYDENTKCWCVPKADMESLIDSIQGVTAQTQSAKS